jgi:hypothetical protein
MGTQSPIAGAQSSCDVTGQAQITASIGGVASSSFYVAVDAPDHLAVSVNPITSAPDIVDQANPLPGYQGYISTITYNLLSSCGQIMVHPAINEEFTAQGRNPDVPNNWPFLTNDDTTFLHYWDTDHGFGFDTFTDTLSVSQPIGGGFMPNPQTPGPYQVPPVPLSTIWLIFQTQIFRAGSISLGSGVTAQTDSQTQYFDHGRNLPPE